MYRDESGLVYKWQLCITKLYKLFQPSLLFFFQETCALFFSSKKSVRSSHQWSMSFIFSSLFFNHNCIGSFGFSPLLFFPPRNTCIIFFFQETCAFNSPMKYVSLYLVICFLNHYCIGTFGFFKRFLKMIFGWWWVCKKISEGLKQNCWTLISDLISRQVIWELYIMDVIITLNWKKKHA